MMIPDNYDECSERGLTPVTFTANLKPFGIAIGMATHYVVEHEPDLLDITGKIGACLAEAAQNQGVEVVDDYNAQADAQLTLTLPAMAIVFMSDYVNRQLDQTHESVREDLADLVLPELTVALRSALTVLKGEVSGLDFENPFDRGSLN